jgi:tRNA1Val (adenine37-N6)-methyltransferase
MASAAFHFKKFSVFQEGAAHPVGTDGVLLGAWADVTDAAQILDIGTGTGLIALMLAQRSAPDAHVTGIDLHAGSVACAQQNFQLSPWKERLSVYETTVQDFAATTTQQFDMIVSNPPFFSELTVSPDPERSLGRHAATLSIPALLKSLNLLLAPAGKCCLILPEKEGRRLCELAVPLGLYCTKELQVRSQESKPVERLLLQLEREPGRFERNNMEIYAVGGGYSEAYLGLTGAYYLKG